MEQQIGKQFYTAGEFSAVLRANGIKASGASIGKLIAADAITAEKTDKGQWLIDHSELDRIIFTAQFLGNSKISNAKLRA